MPASIRRLFLVLSSAGLLSALAAAPAAAQSHRVYWPSCNSSGVSQPFTTWGDPFSYVLVPGGDFETNAWSLDDGARRVAGSEPFAATGNAGLRSLSLPAGASAQSPTTCVDATYPTLRFFIAGSGIVLVELVDGTVALPVGVAVAGGEWAPSSVMVTGAAVPSVVSGGTAQVSLRFTALAGKPRIDDVFIDPWNRG